MSLFMIYGSPRLRTPQPWVTSSVTSVTSVPNHDLQGEKVTDVTGVQRLGLQENHVNCCFLDGHMTWAVAAPSTYHGRHSYWVMADLPRRPDNGSRGSRDSMARTIGAAASVGSACSDCGHRAVGLATAAGA